MVKDDAGMLWVDGELVPASEARVDPRDRGYALGDGLFETMRAREGRLPWGGGDRALRYPGRRSASRGDHETLETNELSEAVIRLTVSRGVPTVCGLLPEPKPAPTLMIGVQSFAGYPSSLYVRGMRAITSLIPRNEPSPLARIKSLSYLEDVLARREADARGADEALLLNTTGRPGMRQRRQPLFRARRRAPYAGLRIGNSARHHAGDLDGRAGPANGADGRQASGAPR